VVTARQREPRMEGVVGRLGDRQAERDEVRLEGGEVDGC
jgi:hypothetical protein